MSIELVLLDDDSDDIYFFKKAVEGLSMSVKAKYFTHADELFTHVDENQDTISILFIDLNLIGTNGFNVIRSIRERPQSWRHRLYAYTTSSLESDVEQAYSLGVCGYFVKPSTIIEITKLLEQVVTLYTEHARIPKPRSGF